MRKRMMKPKIFSFALALFIALGAAKLSVYAEPAENAGQGNPGADLGAVTYSIDSDQIDVSDVTPNSVTVDEETEINMDDPAVAAVASELEDTTVENNEGESIALTDEQIDSILGLYQEYLKQWKDNANLLGVQLPFFLSYNDNNEDGLGILGEMLVLAGHTVDEVRNGEYSYDDLTGMIMNFLYADKYALEYYSDAIAQSRNEALEKVEQSGAKTLPQKMLVINDWLAHKTNFDMAYIMKDDDGNPIMTAEDSQKHDHYDDIYKDMYKVYEEQITKQFHDQIYDSVVAQLRQQYYEGAIKNIVYENALKRIVDDDNTEGAKDEQKEEANNEAEKYMTDNADAISKDAAGFVEENFGTEAAAQISDGADAFIEKAKTEGVEVDPEKAPGVKMTIEEITQNTMKNEPILDLDRDGENETTANDAIPIYAEQAATGLTEGIIGAWEGNHVGPLAEGIGVCAGYSKAFSYLVQYMSPEIYGANGADTDMSVSANWKTPEDLYYNEAGNLDITKNYLVDMVRINFDADVSMFGEASPFGEVHFWNAVQVDGTWYYVDPCYSDIYVECMSRDRVEIDSSMNHLYFMFSHTTATEMYDGNMNTEEGITSLYSEVATDTSYEDSWYARMASNSYSDGENFYYIYDSTDMLDIMREFNSDDYQNFDQDKLNEMKNPEFKLVRHSIDETDIAKDGADTDYITLIEFNPDDSTAKVYDKDGKNPTTNELLTELFAQYKEECSIYPSIKITSALYDGKLYFNLSNCILYYDLETGDVQLVKEYNTVYGKRDKTIAFGGKAFSVVDSKDEADFTVKKRPIASMTIKKDENDNEKMYVSIATNFAFISGKESVNDITSYGYEFEESNYNPDYSNYVNDTEFSDDQLQQMGYTKEINDNDEFMWSAVFVDQFSMNNFSNEAIEYEKSDHKDHHYVHFDEQYYTKDSEGNWNTGDCYVCTICGYAVESSDDGSADDWVEGQDTYNDAKGKAGHTYEPTDATWSDDSTVVSFHDLKCSSVCEERKNVLDCLLEDNTITTHSSKTIKANAKVTASEGYSCDNEGTVVYTATGETEEGYKYTVSKEVNLGPGQHCYKGKFTWDQNKDGAEDKYKVTANLKCDLCEDERTAIEAKVVKTSNVVTCTTDGEDIYTATAEVFSEDGNDVIGSATDIRVDTVDETTGHIYGDLATEITPEFKWSEDYSSATAIFICSRCGETHEESCEITSETTDATCTEAGSTVYTATCEFGGKTYTDDKPGSEVEALGHNYDNHEFKWSEDYSSATAIFTCSRCGETHKESCEITSETTDATCTEAGSTVYTATCEFGGKTYTDDKPGSEVEALGHNYDNHEFKWLEDYSSATAIFTCSRCGEAHEESCEITSETTATCTEAGSTVYTATCEFEGKTYTDEKPGSEVEALGHNYDKYDFTWSEDYSSATAIFTCSRCNERTDSIKCTVTSKITPATCTESGKVVYTASCDMKGKIYTDTKEQKISVLGHNYSNPTWAWSKDYKTATATSTCANCGNKVIQNAKVSYAVTTSPTYTAGGAGVYTATCTINGKSYTDTKKIDLPKLSAEAVLDRSSAGVTAGDKISVTLNSKYVNDAITSVTLDKKAFATVAFSGKSMTISGMSAGTTKATVKTASNETLTITITVKKPVSVTSFTSAVKKIKKDGNASGSVFGTLSARASKAGRTSITLKWNKVSGADGYIIYGNKCGTKYKFTKVATVKKTKTTYAKKKLKKGTYYKFIVAAYKKVNGKQVILSTSKTLHAVTSGTKYVNPKSLKVNATRVTLNQGTTYSLKATEVIQKAKKSKKHRRVAFESSNSQVASVSSGGTVTAKRRGSCTIYVYAQNGIYKKVQVTVK